MIRLVATDLDGTALRWPGQPRVSERLAKAVADVRSAGIPVVVVTGRSRRTAAEIAREIGADRLICSNGALVWDLDNDRVERHHTFEAEVAHAITERIRARAPEAAFFWEAAEEIGFEEPFVDRWGGARKGWEHIVPGPLVERCQAPVIKLIASLHGDLAEQARLYAELADDLADLIGDGALATTAGGSWLEIGPAAITKAVTLAQVAEELGVVATDVIAFGDAPNDLPMLEWAGRAVAMENASPEVKAIADEVTLSNEDDGVAVILEQLLRPTL